MRRREMSRLEESAVRLMEGYEETLDQCGLFLLEEEDLIVEHHIFEEFDTGVYSFFHESNLKQLYAAGLIDLEIMNKSFG